MIKRLSFLLVILLARTANAADVAGIGDSIMEGGCDTDQFNSQIGYGTESGNTNQSVMHMVGWISGGTLTVTNIGLGQGTWYSCNTNSKNWIPVGTKWVVAHCGINDVVGNWTWADMLTNINAIKARCDFLGATFVIDDIWPYGVGTSNQNVTIRDLNTLYHEWANTNRAYYLLSHDAMGAVNPSTGNIDIMNTDYDCNADGVHLDTNGVLVWATNIYTMLQRDRLMNVYRVGSIRTAP